MKNSWDEYAKLWQKQFELDFNQTADYWGAGINEILKRHFRDREKSAIRIHDFTCGTGVQTAGLLKKGYKNVSASDINNTMLLQLNQNIDGLGNKITSFQYDVTQPLPRHLENCFDLAISMNNGRFFTDSVTSLDKPKRAFENFYLSLKENGTFVFSCLQFEEIAKLGAPARPYLQSSFELGSTEAIRYSHRYHWTNHENIFVNESRYEEQTEDGSFIDKVRFSVHRAWTNKEITHTIKSAGFNIVDEFIINRPKNNYSEQYFILQKVKAN